MTDTTTFHMVFNNDGRNEYYVASYVGEKISVGMFRKLSNKLKISLGYNENEFNFISNINNILYPYQIALLKMHGTNFPFTGNTPIHLTVSDHLTLLQWYCSQIDTVSGNGVWSMVKQDTNVSTNHIFLPYGIKLVYDGNDREHSNITKSRLYGFHQYRDIASHHSKPAHALKYCSEYITLVNDNDSVTLSCAYSYIQGLKSYAKKNKTIIVLYDNNLYMENSEHKENIRNVLTECLITEEILFKKFPYKLDFNINYYDKYFYQVFKTNYNLLGDNDALASSIFKLDGAVTTFKYTEKFKFDHVSAFIYSDLMNRVTHTLSPNIIRHTVDGDYYSSRTIFLPHPTTLVAAYFKNERDMIMAQLRYSELF